MSRQLILSQLSRTSSHARGNFLAKLKRVHPSSPFSSVEGGGGRGRGSGRGGGKGGNEGRGRGV